MAGRSTRSVGTPVLPKVTFKGWTNLGFADGHAAGFRGQWQKKGQGGTVNPYWGGTSGWGGERTTYPCP